MFTVAIVGAGELGSLLAQRLAQRDAATDIRLIDDGGRVAEGKALDIMQSAPIERFAARVSGAGDVSVAAGSAVVVVADRVRGGEWSGEDGLMLLQRLKGLVSGAIVVCAGADQRQLIERGSRELRLARRKLIGSAPEALVAAVRAMVALEANTSPQDVSLTIAGVPPDQLVVPWEDATIGGLSAMRTLEDVSRRRVMARLPALWPPGPYALATAASKVIEAIGGRSRARASCFIAPDDSGGRRTRAAALPVRLGPEGLAAVALPELDSRDRVALETAMLL